jgi:hypothetical protein
VATKDVSSIRDQEVAIGEAEAPTRLRILLDEAHILQLQNTVFSLMSSELPSIPATL